MARSRTYWTVATSMLFGGMVLPGVPVYLNRAEAAERARQENRVGQHRGRNVKAVPCDADGRVDWRRVR